MLGSILRLLIAFSSCLNSGFLVVFLICSDSEFDSWSSVENCNFSGVQDKVFLSGTLAEFCSKSSSSFSKSVGKRRSNSSSLSGSSEKKKLMNFLENLEKN